MYVGCEFVVGYFWRLKGCDVVIFILYDEWVWCVLYGGMVCWSVYVYDVCDVFGIEMRYYLDVVVVLVVVVEDGFFDFESIEYVVEVGV